MDGRTCIKLTGAGQYKIDAIQLSNVIIVSAGATLYLQDITITGGNLSDGVAFTDPAPTNSGGGIYNYGELNIQSGVRITGNITNDGMSNHGGGGLFNAKGATVFMTGGEISGNTAGHAGGGVCNQGAFNLSGSAVIKGFI